MKNGIASLSDAEILALILKTGYKGTSILTLTTELLTNYDLKALLSLSYHQLVQIKGINQAKALELLACLEIVRRLFYYQVQNQDIIKNKTDIYRWLQMELGLLNQEKFLVIYLNVKNRIIEYQTLFIGTVDVSIVHPREIFKQAFILSASKIICVHNHPSTDLTPSPADINLTRVLQKTGNLFGIPLLDHLIVANNGYFSCMEALGPD